MASPTVSRTKDARIPSWALVLAGAGLLAALVISLLLLGRVPWCTCGYLRLWHGEVMSSENSQHLTDWYSFTHIIHGFGLYGMLWLVGRQWPMGLRLLLATAVEVAWEIIENTQFVIERYRETTIALDYYGAASSTRSATSFSAWRACSSPPACRSGQPLPWRSRSKRFLPMRSGTT